MTLEVIKNQFTKGGTGLTDGNLSRVLTELQGLSVSVVSGAVAGTGMSVPAIRTEDTILCAAVTTDAAAAAVVDDKANITIQATAAFGTITITGNPTAGESLVVNGNTYTWRAAPVLANDVKITAGNNTTMATDLKNVINAYEARYQSSLNGDGGHVAGVVATSNAGVVTVTSVVDGAGNGPVVTGTVTVLAAAGTGTGLATLTAATVVNTNTCVVNGVTFTAKTTMTVPAVDTEFHVKGTDILQANELARAINAYQFKYGTINVKATTTGASGVVSLVPVAAPTGNAITLTEGCTNVAVTGSGFLTSGTNSGSIKSTTNLSGKTLTLHWFNKR